MAEHIDRTALLADLALNDYPWTDLDDAYNAIQAMPADDVVPVVRCKDCKFYFETHNEMDETLCLNRQWDNGQPWRAIVKPMDFCSYGERKVSTHELP